MNNTFTPKRNAFYLIEGFYTRAICRLLPAIAQTHVTPNQITTVNIINAFCVSIAIWTYNYALASLLIQLYLILDILDGNLARFTQKISKYGKRLDQISDRLFYTLAFLILGYRAENSIGVLIAYAIILNTYAAVTTYYIVPRIRNHIHFRRWGLKNMLMKRKIILGMDLSTQDLIASILLFTPWIHLILPIITALYFADLLFRLIELNRNKGLR